MKKNKRKVPLSMTPEVKQFTKELEDNGFEIVKKSSREGLRLDIEAGIGHLNMAVREIEHLRKTNYEKNLRLNMFDDVMSLLRDKGQQCRDGCASPDHVWDMKKFIDVHSKA